MLHDCRQRHRERRGKFGHGEPGLLRKPHHQRAARGVRECGESAVERGARKLYHLVKYTVKRRRVKRPHDHYEFLIAAAAAYRRASTALTSLTPSSLAHSAGPAILPISQPDGSMITVVGMPNALPAVFSSSNTRALGSE